MRCARQAPEAETQGSGWGRRSRRQRQQQGGGLACGRGKPEPTGRRQRHVPEHSDDEGQGTRSQAFLEHPEPICLARGLDRYQRLRRQPKCSQSPAMHPAMLEKERPGCTPQHRASRPRARIGKATEAAHREAGRESEGRRPVAMVARLQLDEGSGIEAMARQQGIEGDLVQGPARRGGGWHGNARPGTGASPEGVAGRFHAGG